MHNSVMCDDHCCPLSVRSVACLHYNNPERTYSEQSESEKKKKSAYPRDAIHRTGVNCLLHGLGRLAILSNVVYIINIKLFAAQYQVGLILVKLAFELKQSV